MTPRELQTAQEAGNVVHEAPAAAPALVSEPHEKLDSFEEFLPLLLQARLPIRHTATAPTDVPIFFLDHFRTYDDGAARRLYVYVNGTWRYSTLT
jgi:hypothetical protein